jgi:hypothetical protein
MTVGVRIVLSEARLFGLEIGLFSQGNQTLKAKMRTY